MGAVNGYKTSIRIGDAIIILQDAWSFNITQGNTPYTSFGEEFKKNFANAKSWTATSKGTLDRTATGQEALFDQIETGGVVADVALRFYTSTASAPFFAGSASLESIGVDSAVEDRVSVSISWTGNGGIQWTTSTS